MRFLFPAVFLALAVGACAQEPPEADANRTAANASENAVVAATPAAAPRPPAEANAVSLPDFAEGTPYPQVRARLRQMGWAPYAPPDSMRGGGCAQGDERCQGFSETIFCAGTGQATCWYSWRRGERYLLIAGGGETAGQYFGELRECSAIVLSDEHPWDWCVPPDSARRPGAASGGRPRLSAERPTSLSDFLRLFPQAMPAWHRIVPGTSRRTDWIYELAANSSEVRYLRLRGVEYAHGGFCKPHDCFDNNGSFLIAIDGSRAVGATMASQSTWTGSGWVRNSSRETYFGRPSPEERALLRAELHRTGF